MRLALVVLALACTEAEVPLEVLVDCDPNRCAAGERHIWVAGDAPILFVDDTPVATELVGVHGGHRLEFDAEPGQLEARRGNARWRVRIVEPPEHARLATIADERTPEAQTALEAIRDRTEGSERAALTSRLGRIALSLGDDERASQLLDESLTQHLALAEHEEAVLDAVARAWLLQRRLWRYSDALETLERVEPSFSAAPVAAARARNRRGVILGQIGEPRLGERELAVTIEVAEKLGVEQLVHQARIVRAELLHALGRPRAAADSLASAGTDLEGCLRGDHATTRAWLALLDQEQGASIDLGLFEAAERAYATCDASAEQRANAALNTALAHLALDDVSAAQTALSRAGGGGALVQAWELELRGTVALRSGAATDALAVYDELRRRAALAGALGLEWRAHLGRGLALEALDRMTDAANAYSAAEEVLDREAAALSLGTASGWVGRRWRSASRLAALVLHTDPDRALRVLRHARLRALPRRSNDALTNTRGAYDRALRESLADAGESWTLPMDALEELERTRADRIQALRQAIDDSYDRPMMESRSLAPGELLVVVFPHDDGRIVMAKSESTLQGAVTGAEWPSFVAEHSRDAEIVRVVGAGPHAFAVPPVSAPVVHSLDVQRPATSAGDGALMVRDPSGNLEAARREAPLVEASTVLRDRQARFDDVWARLGRVDLFHYAGHAVGGESLDSHLRLFDVPLTAADVIALSHAPRHVLLNGCESARGVGLVPIGVAQAFVLAGSEIVIGFVDPVEDARGASLATRLRAADRTAGEWARIIQSDDPPGGFRVFVP